MTTCDSDDFAGLMQIDWRRSGGIRAKMGFVAEAMADGAVETIVGCDDITLTELLPPVLLCDETVY